METNKERRQRILNRQSQQSQLIRYTTVLGIEANGSQAHTNQEKLVNEATDIEKGLRMMIEGVEYYCKGVSKGWEQPLGEDSVLGLEIGSIINGLLGLLNGPGHFDGATCDQALRAIAKKHAIENVEV